MPIRSRPLFVGLFFLAVAGIFFVQSLSHVLGTARAMGPAFFPRVTSITLALIGCLIIVRGLRPAARDDLIEAWNPRTLSTIAGSVVVFALLLRPAGLIGAIVAMVFFARLSSRRFHWLGSIVLGLALAALCAIIFVYSLGVRLPLLPIWVG